MKKTKTVAVFGIMLALYVVVSTFAHIPIPIGHAWFDLGYVVYGLMMALYGLPAIVIGVLGVLIENVLFSGWISYSWIAGQIVIGLACGYMFKHCDNDIINSIVAAVATWVGVGFVKTIIEVAMGYGVFPVKIVNNSIYALADYIPLMVGYFLSKAKPIKDAARRLM